MYKGYYTTAPLQTNSPSCGFETPQNITSDIYFTRHNRCWRLYIPVIIHVAADAYSDPLQDIGASREDCVFLFFWIGETCPKSTLSTLSMQRANLFTTNLKYFFRKHTRHKVLVSMNTKSWLMCTSSYTEATFTNPKSLR